MIVSTFVRSVLLVAAMLVVTSGRSFRPADQIIGTWYFPARDSKIEFYRHQNHYHARIVEVGSNWRKNVEQMQGQVVISGLQYKGHEWAGGQFIHPETKSRYDVALSMKNPEMLVVTIYKGLRLLRRELTLVRENALPSKS